MNLELKKAEEFSNVRHLKAKYKKFVDENGNFVYELELPTNEVVKDVHSSLALYVHSLERRLKLM